MTLEQLLIGAVSHPEVPLDIDLEQLSAVERHPLAPLAWHVLSSTGHSPRWLPELLPKLRRADVARALASEIVDTELRRVLTAAGEASIRTVLIKGAALAYTHYPRPHVRARSDSDVVIAERDRGAMTDVLKRLGYARTAAIEGTLLTQQAQWTRVLGADLVHALDLHWRVFNPHLFAHLLSPEQLAGRAVPVRALGPHAFAPCAVDALVLACVHRAAHHVGEEDPLWDYDVHLLLASLSRRESEELAAIVAVSGLRAVVAAALASAQSRFGSVLPAALQSLAADAAARREPTAVFLEPGRRLVDVLSSDLATLPTWRQRARLLRQHLFPPTAYIRARYGLRSAALLPFAYVHRIVAGVPRWFRSQGS